MRIKIPVRQYEVVGARVFSAGNIYSAQNMLYELTDAMSKHRDYDLKVTLEVKDYGYEDIPEEIVLKIINEIK